MNKVLSEVSDDLTASKIKNIGNNKQLRNAFQDLYDDIVDTVGKSKVDLSTANDLKIGTGAQGA
mgnify:FL=1